MESNEEEFDLDTVGISNFKDDLSVLISQYLIDIDLDTPNFILAQYLSDCLVAYDKILKSRKKWNTLGTIENEDLKFE